MEKKIEENIDKAIEEIDRCARAYGFEIGRGQSLEQKVNVSKDNPFVDKNWRKINGLL